MKERASSGSPRVQRDRGRLATLLVAASLVLAPSPALAASDDVDDELIVSASRSARARAIVPSFTTVLEGEALESGISTSLADALRFVPGLQLIQPGARGGRSALALRGLDPNHVLVLVDGVRLNDPMNSRGGSFDPTTLALVEIDRVEVIRGSLSSVYGSDALAGVINVITRKAEPDDELRSTIRGRGGRFHTGSVVAQASSGIAGMAGLSLGAAYDTSRDPNSDGGYDGVSAKAKLDVPLPFEFDLEAFTRLHWSSARAFPDSSGGPERAGLRKLEDRDVREILVGLSLARELGSYGSLDLRASRAGRREDVDSPGIDNDPADPTNPDVVPPSRTSDDYERWDLALSSSWRLPEIDLSVLTAHTRLVAGADAVWEDGTSHAAIDFGGGFTPFPFADHRRTLGVFAEVEEQLGPYVVISAGLRFDATPDEEDRLSPTAGLSIDLPGTTLTLFASYGEGFKRPSFFALENPLVGNPSLAVEESRGFEAGLRGAAWDGRFRGQISYFDIEVEELIDFDATTFSLVNRGRLMSRGVELELDWQPGDWLEVRAGGTFNPTDFGGSDLDPENRSRWRGYGELVIRPVPSVELGLRALAVSSIHASSFQTGSRVLTLAGYERLDLRMGWRPRDWLELFVEIENLTDRTYREAIGFESPGIAPRAGIVLRH